MKPQQSVEALERIAPVHPRVSYSLAEMEVMTGLSRSKIYQLVKSGEIQTFKIGRRRLVGASEALLFAERMSQIRSQTTKIPPLMNPAVAGSLLTFSFMARGASAAPAPSFGAQEIDHAD